MQSNMHIYDVPTKCVPLCKHAELIHALSMQNSPAIPTPALPPMVLTNVKSARSRVQGLLPTMEGWTGTTALDRSNGSAELGHEPSQTTIF